MSSVDSCDAGLGLTSWVRGFSRAYLSRDLSDLQEANHIHRARIQGHHHLSVVYTVHHMIGPYD